MTGQERIEYGTGVLIYEDRMGNVVMSLITGPKNSYERGLESTRSFSRRIIFERYGISDAQDDFFMRQMENIDNQPLSEVSEQVDDLVSRLKEEIGETQ